MTGPAKPKRCTALLRTPWGYDTCDLPKGHAGPHHAKNPNRPLEERKRP